jgi:hypothetical protein
LAFEHDALDPLRPTHRPFRPFIDRARSPHTPLTHPSAGGSIGPRSDPVLQRVFDERLQHERRKRQVECDWIDVPGDV